MFGRKKNPEQQPTRKTPVREHERLMGSVYRLVACHRDSDAIFLLMNEFDYLQTPMQEFEALYQRAEQWGPSKTLLCLGRLIIYRLDREKRHGQVITYIEKCQKISPKFILPELSRVTFYARQAIAAGKLEVAKNLCVEYETRYAGLVGSGECERLLQLIEPDIDVTGFQ